MQAGRPQGLGLALGPPVGVASGCDRGRALHRYVVDIRNNGGGLFPAGVDVARMWLDSGDIVLIADGTGAPPAFGCLEPGGVRARQEALARVEQNRSRCSHIWVCTLWQLLQQCLRMAAAAADGARGCTQA